MRLIIHTGFAILFFLAAMTETASAALIIQGYSPDQHERFSGTSFIGNGLDLSGISNWRPNVNALNTWATMISPSYFLAARHNAPAIGTAFTFYDGNSLLGGSATRTVISGETLVDSDLWIGRLNSAVPSTIAKYPIATGNLSGATLAVVGSSTTVDGQRLGRNVVDLQFDGFNSPNLTGTGDIYIYDFDSTSSAGPDEAYLQGGDSGAPSLTLVGGNLAITGIHWFIYGPSLIPGTDAEFGSGDSRVGSYMNSINAAMSGSGEFATFVAVPEPSSLLTTGFMVVGYLLSRRRRPSKGPGSVSNNV